MDEYTHFGPDIQSGTEEMKVWRDSAGRLATFAFANLVNRDDRFGRYRPIERREYGKCLVERSPVTLELLERQ